MTPSDIAKFRIISQQIKNPNLKSSAEMIAYFGAIQGQEYAQTKWSLGLRMPHLKNNDIEKDFTEGNILRTHLLRPTWHFVSPEDIRWLLELTEPRVNSINLYMYKKMELDNTVFNRCNDIMIAAWDIKTGIASCRSKMPSSLKKSFGLTILSFLTAKLLVRGEES